MANILLGGGVTDIRGSIGGTTFARNAAGNYARARMKPVNPRSPLQNARRAFLNYLANYWSATLTEDQRDDWRAYAAGTTWTNRLGQTIAINGLAAFVRLNTLRYIAFMSLMADAPTAMGHAGGITFAFDAETDTTNIKVAKPGGAFNESTENHMVLLFQGLPSEAGRISIPKGFVYIGRVYGKLEPPMEFPVDIDANYTMQDGQLITCRAMFMDEHSRVSGPFWAQATAAPST